MQDFLALGELDTLLSRDQRPGCPRLDCPKDGVPVAQQMFKRVLMLQH